MNQTLLALILIIVSSIFGSVGLLQFKIASAKKINFKNKHLHFAVILNAISLILYIFALKLAALTIVYLATSISYVWAVLLGKFVLHEKVNQFKIVGVIMIILGIVIMNI